MNNKKPIVAVFAGFVLLCQMGVANASSLIATAEIRLCCASSGDDPELFSLEIRHANYSDGQPALSLPTTSKTLFYFFDLESLTVGASKERTSGGQFDTAVQYLTNGIGYGPDSYDTIESITRSPGVTRTSIGNERGLFGLDTNDLAGFAIDKIEVVLTQIDINRDHVFPGYGEGYAFDIRYDYNIYGTALVPVPGALLFFGSSLFALLALRSRRLA